MLLTCNGVLCTGDVQASGSARVLGSSGAQAAGRPGWGGFIPIYNIYLQIKLVGRSGILLLLYVVPIVNLITAIVVAVGVARAFGKGPFYGFFLLFLFQPIGYLILGFGSARYSEIRR